MQTHGFPSEGFFSKHKAIAAQLKKVFSDSLHVASKWVADTVTAPADPTATLYICCFSYRLVWPPCLITIVNPTSSLSYQWLHMVFCEQVPGQCSHGSELCCVKSGKCLQNRCTSASCLRAHHKHICLQKSVVATT